MCISSGSTKGKYLFLICVSDVVCTDIGISHYGIKHNIKKPNNICRLVKVKIMCNLVQALRLCTGRTAHRGSRGIAVLFLDHGTRSR